MNLTNKKSFFITLMSNSSLNVYPNNTLSQFTNKLPYTLELNEQWSVGLVKFSCTTINEDKIEIEPKVKFIHVGGFDTTINLFDIIKPHTPFFNSIGENFFNRYDKDLNLIKPFLSKDVCQIIILDMIFIFHLNVEFTPTKFFDEIFAQAPKETWPKMIKHFEKSRSITVNKEKTDIILQRIKYIQPNTLTNEIPNYMCFYSDLVEAQIFGNMMTKGMLMHPVKFNKQYQNCDITNIQFLPLEKTRITDISILIADERGEQINFKNDTFNTMIVLKFQKGI